MRLVRDFQVFERILNLRQRGDSISSHHLKTMGRRPDCGPVIFQFASPVVQSL